jgi:hypothetical protein
MSKQCGGFMKIRDAVNEAQNMPWEVAHLAACLKGEGTVLVNKDGDLTWQKKWGPRLTADKAVLKTYWDVLSNLASSHPKEEVRRWFNVEQERMKNFSVGLHDYEVVGYKGIDGEVAYYLLYRKVGVGTTDHPDQGTCNAQVGGRFRTPKEAYLYASFLEEADELEATMRRAARRLEYCRAVLNSWQWL